MKKILSVLFALSIIPAAFAEKLIVTYDSANKMQSMEIYSDNKQYEIPEGGSAFLYNPIENMREEYLPKTEEEKFPAIYEKEINAMTTFAVVKEVYQTTFNDEPVTGVDVVYQGKDTTFFIEEHITINYATEAYAHISGQPVASLIPGDIINVAANMSGEIRTVNLIARIEENIITSETDYGKDFEKLYGEAGYIYWGSKQYPICSYGGNNSGDIQYQFGVICNIGDKYYELANKGGKWSDFQAIPFEEGTVVYTCDMSKKAKVELADVYALQNSVILPEDFDSDDNISRWSDGGEYVYALSRTIKGVATDIVMFYNF